MADIQPRRWVDDPWSAMTEEDQRVWLAGYEAAKDQAVTLARSAPIPKDASPSEAHGRLSGALIAAEAIAAMQPLAEAEGGR